MRLHLLCAFRKTHRIPPHSANHRDWDGHDVSVFQSTSVSGFGLLMHAFFRAQDFHAARAYNGQFQKIPCLDQRQNTNVYLDEGPRLSS